MASNLTIQYKTKINLSQHKKQITLMKLFFLLALPSAIFGLTQFKDKIQLVKCIQTCEKAVTPCISDKKSDCPKVYINCIDSKDPFACLSSVNIQCFDGQCKEDEEEEYFKTRMDEIKEDQEQQGQFAKKQPKITVSKQGGQTVSSTSSNGENKKEQQIEQGNL